MECHVCLWDFSTRDGKHLKISLILLSEAFFVHEASIPWTQILSPVCPPTLATYSVAKKHLLPFFSFWRHSSCSVLLLNEAMFYQLHFSDLQILVAALSQSSHHQPLPVFPPPQNTQAFQLGQSSCSRGQCWSGTHLVEAKAKPNQNTYTKKEKNQYPFYFTGAFVHSLNHQQFLMWLAAESHEELFRYNWEKAELE